MGVRSRPRGEDVLSAQGLGALKRGGIVAIVGQHACLEAEHVGVILLDGRLYLTHAGEKV